ncbi:MAG TPA: IS21 family transposase [Syntrophales bacterium]|nr:IS21 family transposase [Syntrophales bacterium]
MGYRRMTIDNIGAIWLRLKAGESNRAIAKALLLDKKTVNEIASRIHRLDLPSGLKYLEALPLLESLLRANNRPAKALEIFEPYRDEIRTLIAGDKSIKQTPMKAKTAWLVIRDKYGLSGRVSYETYKRFVRASGFSSPGSKASDRIEVDPGEEVQIDYGKMGVWPVGGKDRVISAYVGVLSFSRLPYVNFVVSQNTTSFASSTVEMFEFYGGVPRRIVPDNLKAAVIIAHMFDPVLNRTFLELCDHYETIGDPARPAMPKDKGKVERLVPVVRELWKRLTVLHPSATLEELNELALRWCTEEYGLSIHGTTGERPWTRFLVQEKAALRQLPPERYEIARWTRATGHKDQFFTVNKKRFSLPAAYIGKVVEVRVSSKLVEIFSEHQSIRRYVLDERTRYSENSDFPPWSKPFEPGAMAEFIQGEAAGISAQAAEYIAIVLGPGTQVSWRRGLRVIDILRKHHLDPGFTHVLSRAIVEHIVVPDRLAALFFDENRQFIIPFPVSDLGQRMARKADYYVDP